MQTKASKILIVAFILLPLSACDSAGGDPTKSPGVITDKVTPGLPPVATPSPIPSASPSPTPTTLNLDGTWKYQFEVCGTTVTSLPYNHFLDISGSQMIIRTRVSDGSSFCTGSNPSLIEDIDYSNGDFVTTPVKAYNYAGNCLNPTLNFVTGPQTANETFVMSNPTTLVIFSATNCGTSGAPKRTFYAKQ